MIIYFRSDDKTLWYSSNKRTYGLYNATSIWRGWMLVTMVSRNKFIIAKWRCVKFFFQLYIYILNKEENITTDIRNSRGLNKGRGSKFPEGSRVQLETPEEYQRTYRPKRCEYINKDEENNLKTIISVWFKYFSIYFCHLIRFTKIYQYSCLI